MTVFINGEGVECDANTLLADFLEQQKINTTNIAIAINDAIVFRKNWTTTLLTNGCNILIIRPTQGG